MIGACKKLISTNVSNFNTSLFKNLDICFNYVVT